MNENDENDPPYTEPKDVRGVLDEFEWLGIVRRSGYRKGKPVYVLTEFGEKLGDDNPGDKFEPAVKALVRRKLAH